MTNVEASGRRNQCPRPLWLDGKETRMETVCRRLATLITAAALIFVSGVVHRARADDNCFYKGSMFSAGSSACQAGQEHRCDDGKWKSTGLNCTNGAPAASKTCESKGISYSTGAASCQDGVQFRCEDGRWATLGKPCTVGDSPISAIPNGRTCMFDGATVASTSTLCRSGSTYLCNDGEWINLGTLCQ